MDYVLSDDEWVVVSPLLGLTPENSRGRAAAQACLFRHSAQMAASYRSFGWHSLPSELLGITGNAANRRFLRWSTSGQWLQFWDRLIELRYGRAKPEKPDKAISTSNPHRSLTLELERAYRFFNKRFTGGELPLAVVISVEVAIRSAGYLRPEHWKVGETPLQHHLAIASSTVARGSVEDVLETLLHEMAHLRNIVMEIVDTDCRTQYHGQDFRDSALLFGLTCGQRNINHGFALTKLGDRGIEAIRQFKPVASVFQWRHRSAE